MPRVDLERRQVVASVRDLAYAGSDALSPDGPWGAARARLGCDAHRTYREARERRVPGFAAEVPVSGVQQVDGFTAQLTGRIDGLVREGGARLLVEEAKSLTVGGAGLQALREEDLPEAVLQLRAYALLLARSRPGARVRARLVLISLLDGAQRELDVSLRPVRTEQALVRRLRTLVRAARARIRRVRRGATLAKRLRFPYPEARPYQREMVGFVRTCLESGRPALVEAPTGIGKTVAALLPALQHARRHDALLYVLTAKRTQRARVAATFEDLAEAAGRKAGALKALTLRPREGMCPTGTLQCHAQHCTLLANLQVAARREKALAALLAGGPHIDAQEVLDVGTWRGLCPHALSLLLCARVDLVIGDYNHVYGTSRPPGRFPGEILPRPVVVVVDEAHNLFDRAREHDSPFLARREVAAVQSGLQREGGALAQRLARHLAEVGRLVDGIVAEAADAGPAFSDGCRPIRGDAAPWESLAIGGARLLVPYVQRQQARGRTRVDDPLLAVLHRVGRLRDLLRSDDPALVPYAACADGSPRGPGVGVFCVDPSARLAARHEEVLGTVAMSATLTPAAHYRSVLGFDDLDPRAVAYASPFPAEQRCVAVVPTLSTTWRARRHCYATVARTIEQVIAVRPGHYVAYFPSFAFLAAVRARLRLSPDGLLVQTPRMSDEARAAVLARLVRDPGPVLLLAVAGGVFAEGIDLPGEALVGAIVVGPALPQVGFERAAMRHHFDQAGGDGFARAMLVPGLQRVVQAAGRVHRAPEDRGVIVLLGRRFAQPPYADGLPPHWFRYGVEEAITGDPVPRLASFWRNGSAPSASGSRSVPSPAVSSPGAG